MNRDGIETKDDSLELQTLGEAFVRCFHHLLNMPKIHEADNRLAIQASKAFIDAGTQLLGIIDEIVLEPRHGRLFLSGHKLLMRQQAAIYIFGLLSVFETLMPDGLKFNYRFKTISPAQAHRFASLVTQARDEENPAAFFAGRLSEPGFQFVEVLSVTEDTASRIPYSRKARQAHRMYSFVYNSIKDVSREILQNKRAGTRKSLRVIQEIVDFTVQDKSILFGLTTIRDYDDYTYIHSVNVAILAICLGHHIGLSEKSLVYLGICGLFHDLGKIDIPIEIISKPDPLTEDEYKIIQQHSLNSVRQILKLEAHSELISRIVLAPFEHHLKYDLSGYPSVSWKRPISLFGRIIEICDVYDALTSPRIYRSAPYSPDRALGAIAAKSGKDFDPVLVKWFVNMLGIFPIGTLVVLNTGEYGLVCEGNAVKNDHKPKVLLLEERLPGQYFSSKVVDLNKCDPETGKYLRAIKSTHHASEFGIQPATHLMEMQHI